MKLVILFLTAAVFFGCGAADKNAHAPCSAEIYTNEMSKIYKSKLLVYRGVAQEIASAINLSYSDFELKKVVQTPEVTRYVCTAKVTGVWAKTKLPQTSSTASKRTKSTTAKTSTSSPLM